MYKGIYTYNYTYMYTRTHTNAFKHNSSIHTDMHTYRLIYLYKMISCYSSESLITPRFPLLCNRQLSYEKLGIIK